MRQSPKCREIPVVILSSSDAKRDRSGCRTAAGQPIYPQADAAGGISSSRDHLQGRAGPFFRNSGQGPTPTAPPNLPAAAGNRSDNRFPSSAGITACIRGRMRDHSDPERATEAPGGIVRFRAVVIHENSVVAAITKEGAAALFDIRRRLHPTRRFRIELSQRLQGPDIAPPLKAQCPCQPPYPKRYLPVYVLSVPPGLRGRSKDFCGPSGFRQNNRKKYIRPSSYHDRQRPARPPVLSISLSDHSLSAFASSLACTLAHARPLCRFMCFSKRAFKALSSSSRCSGDKPPFFIHVSPSCCSHRLRFPRFLSVTPLYCAPSDFFRAVFTFLSIRSFHAVRSAPVSTSSLAAARRICVCPILPQPPGIGRKIPGTSSTNAACWSSVSIRFPYPPACEASEANFLPPTRKACTPPWGYSSTPSRLSAILRKSAAVIG